MKQTNKMRRVVSAALFCTSLFLLTGITGCSKDVVNEETPQTKAINVGQGTESDPYHRGYCPMFDYHEGGTFSYFTMENKWCSFRVTNLANQHGMTVTVTSRPGTKTITAEMMHFPSRDLIGGAVITTDASTVSLNLRIPPAACGGRPAPFLPEENVIVYVKSTLTDVVGVAFTYFRDPVKPDLPGPTPGA